MPRTKGAKAAKTTTANNKSKTRTKKSHSKPSKFSYFDVVDRMEKSAVINDVEEIEDSVEKQALLMVLDGEDITNIDEDADLEKPKRRKTNNKKLLDEDKTSDVPLEEDSFRIMKRLEEERNRVNYWKACLLHIQMELGVN